MESGNHYILHAHCIAILIRLHTHTYTTCNQPMWPMCYLSIFHLHSTSCARCGFCVKCAPIFPSCVTFNLLAVCVYNVSNRPVWLSHLSIYVECYRNMNETTTRKNDIDDDDDDKKWNTYNGNEKNISNLFFAHGITTESAW